MTSINFTVIGAQGFIGSHLVKHLINLGHQCSTPCKTENLEGKDLGHVIYCAGLTADFRSRPWDTIDAHVCSINRILSTGQFSSLLYLSSTRIYQHAAKNQLASEDDPITVDPQDPSDLYNLSKLMGESACLAHSNRAVRIARLSNVYGPDLDSNNFLGSIVRDACTGKLELLSDLSSEKDYIAVNDVVEGLYHIATRGKERIYNLCSGENISNRQIVEQLLRLKKFELELAPHAPQHHFPPLDNGRIRNEFGITPASLMDNLAQLVSLYSQS